eukprot:scaffold6011_cov137-Isochrysis_galbana.AAC.1
MDASAVARCEAHACILRSFWSESARNMPREARPAHTCHRSVPGKRENEHSHSAPRNMWSARRVGASVFPTCDKARDSAELMAAGRPFSGRRHLLPWSLKAMAPARTCKTSHALRKECHAAWMQSGAPAASPAKT